MRKKLIAVTIVVVVAGVAFGLYWYATQPFSVITPNGTFLHSKQKGKSQSNYRYEVIGEKEGHCYFNDATLGDCIVRVYKNNDVVLEVIGIREIEKKLGGLPEKIEGNILYTAIGFADGGIHATTHNSYDLETGKVSYLYSYTNIVDEAIEFATPTIQYLVVLDGRKEQYDDQSNPAGQTSKEYRFYVRGATKDPWFISECTLLNYAECTRSHEPQFSFTEPGEVNEPFLYDVVVQDEVAQVRESRERQQPWLKPLTPKFELDLEKPGVKKI